MWQVEIYYKEPLNQIPLACIRLRHSDPVTKEIGSFGDDLATIYRLWQQIDDIVKGDVLSS